MSKHLSTEDYIAQFDAVLHGHEELIEELQEEVERLKTDLEEWKRIAMGGDYVPPADFAAFQNEEGFE